jgi:sugar PTS system EIIA component
MAVLTPFPGRVLPMGEVPDPVFSAALVGPGVAVQPYGDDSGSRVEAVAPVAGRLVKLHPHAFVVQAPDGAGVLVHLGIDTVQLKGEGFELLATEGVDVEAGQPVVAWDPAAVEAGGRSTVCPVVALDAGADALTEVRDSGDVGPGELLFTWQR